MKGLKIVISDAYDEIRRQMCISINKIRQTIQSPDDVTIVDLRKVEKELTGQSKGEKVSAGFYLKRYSTRDGEYHLLVCTREPKGRIKYVEGAYKIYDQIVSGIGEIAPIEILRRFLDHFGIDINIGKKTSRFIFRELLPLKTGLPTTISFGRIPRDHNFTVGQYIKIDSTSKQILCALAYAIDNTKYLKWLKTRMQNITQLDLLNYQKRLLEELFPEEWFFQTKNKTHPAYFRWTLCNRLIKQGVIRFPEQERELSEIGRILLDSYILSLVTKSDMESLKLGSLELYGDKKVQKKILSRVSNSKQFEDIMTELYIGAWHLTKGHNVIPFEEEGFPDFKIKFPNVTIPAFFECKHIWTHSKRRIVDVVRKANKQIKKPRERGYGILLLDLTIPTSAGQVENDRLPIPIKETINVIKSSLSGKKNRSVGAVLIVWDDQMRIGYPPERTLLTFRRRCIRVNHTQPNIVVPDTLSLFDGFTVEFWVTWLPRFNRNNKRTS